MVYVLTLCSILGQGGLFVRPALGQRIFNVTTRGHRQQVQVYICGTKRRRLTNAIMFFTFVVFKTSTTRVGGSIILYLRRR